MGLEGEIRKEVWTSANTLIQNHTEQEPETQKESTVTEVIRKCLIWGKLKQRTRARAQVVCLHVYHQGEITGNWALRKGENRKHQQTRPKQEKDNDPSIEEQERLGNVQESGSAQNQGVTTERDRKYWSRYTDHNYRCGMPNWNQNQGPPTPTKGISSSSKGRNQNPVG